MHQNINQLRNEVNEKMIKKFGMKIDFDEMEEAILTRLLTKHTNNSDHMKNMEKEIRKLDVMPLLGSLQ